jgi:DNA-binding transcriptional MerR regulator
VTQAGEAEADRHHSKSAAAFRTTGEVAKELDVPAHVLRFWESKFPQIRPLKRGGGRRYYRPEDVDLLRHIRQCLYQEGYTIRGVQKLLRERRQRNGDPEEGPTEAEMPAGLFAYASDDGAAPATDPAPSAEALHAALVEMRRELQEIRALLDKLAPP